VLYVTQLLISLVFVILFVLGLYALSRYTLGFVSEELAELCASMLLDYAWVFAVTAVLIAFTPV
jgi:hypothetical protein